jgi:putative ABC transport system substrate-binding protein
MRRRRFIAAISGTTIIWSLIQRTRAAGGIPLVGIFLPSPTTADARLESFLRELAALGWRENDTVRFERRFFANDPPEPGRIDALAAELVALKPKVIWTLSAPATGALERATHSLPVVFMNVADPVASGFAANIARPGSNATGFSVAEPTAGGKWLEILRDIAPHVSHVGMLYEAGTPDGGIRDNLVAAAADLRLSTTAFALRGPADVATAIAEVAGAPGGGLIVSPSNTTAIYRQQIIGLAAARRLPAVYAYEFFARDGGLVAYGADLLLQASGCAAYVDKILRGAEPGELPIQYPTKYKIVINLKTAKALGLTVPQSLLARADEVIE